MLTDRVVDLCGEAVDLAFGVGPLKDSRLIARKFRDGEVFLGQLSTLQSEALLPSKRFNRASRSQTTGLGDL